MQSGLPALSSSGNRSSGQELVQETTVIGLTVQVEEGRSRLEQPEHRLELGPVIVSVVVALLSISSMLVRAASRACSNVA